MSAPNPFQPPLPSPEMYQTCPLCGQPAAILGQHGPLWSAGICRTCSLALPYPIEVFQVDPSSKDRSGLRINPQADYAAKERRIDLDNLLRDAVRGQLTQEQFYKFNITLNQLRNPHRRSRARQYAGWLKEARISNRHRQLSLPLCERCGCAHDNRYKLSGDVRTYCQRCDAEMGVESLWHNRGIFSDTDPETQLDKLYKTFPEWFAIGVLPDYWFRLAQKG